MNEQELKDKIKKSGDNIEAPESLEPEQIKKILVTGKEPGKKKYRKYLQWGAIAAVFVMAIFGCITALSRITPGGSSQQENDTVNLAKAETEAAEETVTEQGSLTGDLSTMLEGETVEPSSEGDYTFKPAETYEDIYAALEKLYRSSETAGEMTESAVADSAAIQPRSMEGAAVMESAATVGSDAGNATSGVDNSQTGDYSKTNLREADVDEGDVVKTDGTFLYVMKRSGKVQIVEAKSGDMEQTGSIVLENLNETPEEMYIDGDTLYLIVSGSESSMSEDDTDMYYVESNNYTKLYTFDMKDRSKPEQKGVVSQEGYYRTSRKNGKNIYLFSEYMPVMNGAKEINSYIPEVGESRMLSTDIYIPEYVNDSSYLVMTSVNADKPEEFADRKAVVSAASIFYISSESIFICNNDWSGSGNTTQILKFRYKDGEIKAAAAGDVKGYVNDSFSLDEYRGNLRVVTTDNAGETTTNALYVLDENLEICGSIRDLAQGETIQSARFLGESGYFVTYRNMDPLFSVDLSDPQNPTILGELKITGFSSYLHFYRENLLLGIGNETDPETGAYLGIKLSMFDISDPANVKEVNKYVIKDVYDCSVFSNYKSIMLDTEKNLMGFTCDNEYMIFTYDEETGFENSFVEKLENMDSYYTSYDLRGCYIGETFYLINSEEIRAYDMADDYKGISKLEL